MCYFVKKVVAAMGGRPLSEVYNADTDLSNLFMDADRRNIPYSCKYTRWFTTCGHYCRRWFPRYLWSRKWISIWVLFTKITELWMFLIAVNTLQWTVCCKSHYITLNHWEQKRPMEAATRNLHCSQPSSSMSCSQQWYFHKTAYSTGQCQLKGISWN